VFSVDSKDLEKRSLSSGHCNKIYREVQIKISSCTTASKFIMFFGLEVIL
jgi:hypothetical protein